MAPGLKSGPVTRVCHVCGRQYGLSSFDIHLKQCKKLWISQEDLKPLNERRPLPKTPPKLDGSGSISAGGGSMSREDVEALNRAAQEAFNVHGMEKCEFCGRTFAEGRLAIHNRSCRADSVAKKVTDGAIPRNKPVPQVEYGRVRDRADSSSGSPQQTANAQLPNSVVTETRTPPQTAGPARPLAGSIASNRKRIQSRESTTSSSSRTAAQFPLEDNVLSSINASELREHFSGKQDLILAIEAKLARWEASTVATLQEIRDLKDLFAQTR